MAFIKGINDFSAAPAGWQAALAMGNSTEIVLVPIVGWARVTGVQPAVEGSPLDAVVLFDKAGAPLIQCLGQILEDWSDGSFVHQILPPGVEVRAVPDGWTVRTYAD